MDLGDGGPPLSHQTRERAWRVKDGPWRREPNAKILLVSVVRYLASIDVRGRQRFYDEAVTATGLPMFSDTKQVRPKHWVPVEPDIVKFVNVNHSYESARRLIAQACSQCQTAIGAPLRLGEDIEVVLDLSSG